MTWFRPSLTFWDYYPFHLCKSQLTKVWGLPTIESRVSPFQPLSHSVQSRAHLRAPRTASPRLISSCGACAAVWVICRCRANTPRPDTAEQACDVTAPDTRGQVSLTFIVLLTQKSSLASSCAKTHTFMSPACRFHRGVSLYSILSCPRASSGRACYNSAHCSVFSCEPELILDVHSKFLLAQRTTLSCSQLKPHGAKARTGTQ